MKRNGRMINKGIKKRKIIRLVFLLVLVTGIAGGVAWWNFTNRHEELQKPLGDDSLTIMEAVESIRALFDTQDYIQYQKLKGRKKDTLQEKTVEQMLRQMQLTKEQKREIQEVVEKEDGTSGEKKEYVTREQWGDCLLLLAKDVGIDGVCKKIHTGVFSQGDKFVTGEGVYTYTGKENYQDQKIHGIVRDKELIFVIASESEVIYKNLLVKTWNEQNLCVSLEGIERSFSMHDSAEPESKLSDWCLCDLVLREGTVQELHFKQERITGKIQSISEEIIEVEGYGKIPMDKGVRVFDETTMEPISFQKLNVGSESTHFVVGNGMICGAFYQEVAETPGIRVMLMTTGFQDLFHRQLEITCDGAFHLTFYEPGEDETTTGGTEVVHPYGAGAVAALTPENPILSYSRIRITPVDAANKLKILSFKRNGAVPEYRGSIEVSVYEGKLVIVNDVSLEEYLYAVVPSEMPSSYGVEALKVQAVCARSYAMSHLQAGALAKYGAHVDDSVNYQVYNNTPETENSIQAVNETKGKVLRYQGNIIHAYFYATSCGSTADGTVWSNQEIPYIQSRYLNQETDTPDLMNNDVFTLFIKEKPNTYDSSSAWYRWQVTLSYAAITKCVNERVYSLYCNHKQQILTLGEHGVFESRPVHSVGTVTEVSVTKRGRGGIVEELLIKGTEGQILVLKQGNIRNLFNPNGNEMIRNDGSKISTMKALPSGFFAAEPGADGNSVIFYGGGYGHGAGMSQTAVKAMVDQNMNHREILEFFYPGTELGL